MNLPASPSYQDISPPIVGYNLNIISCAAQELEGSMIENHGITSTNILHECIVKTGFFFKKQRTFERNTRFTDKPSARTIQGGDCLRNSVQPSQGPFQFIGIPNIILVRISIIIPVDIVFTNQRQKIGREAFARTRLNHKPMRAEFGLVIA